jgi:hypothetical protein
MGFQEFDIIVEGVFRVDGLQVGMDAMARLDHMKKSAGVGLFRNNLSLTTLDHDRTLLDVKDRKDIQEMVEEFLTFGIVDDDGLDYSYDVFSWRHLFSLSSTDINERCSKERVLCAVFVKRKQTHTKHEQDVIMSTRSIIYFGAPNSDNATVSESLRRRGLNLLRSVPSSCGVEGHRDFPQQGFDVYSQNLPAFIQAAITKEPVNLLSMGFDVSIPTEKMLPFAWPEVILAWKIPVAQEVIDGIKERFSYTEKTIVAANGPCIGVTPKTADDLRFIKSLKSNPITQASVETVNPQCIMSVVQINKIATMFGITHHYPMVFDDDHARSLLDVYELEEDTRSTGVPRELGEEGEVMNEDYGLKELGGDKIKIPTEYYRQIIKVPKARQREIRPYYFDNVTQIPNSKGLFFPFIEELSSYDGVMVPTVIERHFYKLLGATAGEQQSRFATLKCDWGVIHKTRMGKELSHLYKMIDLAIRTQAIALPFFTDNIYQGAVLLGNCFQIRVRSEFCRPVSRDQLVGGIVDSNAHKIAMNKIGAVLKRPNYEAKSSKELCIDVQSASLTTSERTEIVDFAKDLSFNEQKYPINSTSFRVVANIISHVKDIRGLPEGFPVYPALLFSRNMLHIAWGAFGDMAPSFLVPSGTKFMLSKSWKEEVPGRSGQGAVSRDVTRIACRNVKWDQALKDLDVMVKEKYVLNTLNKQGARRSQFNMDRFFTQGDFRSVVESLRMICDVVVVDSGAGKRKAGDEIDEDRPQKKAAFDEL